MAWHDHGYQDQVHCVHTARSFVMVKLIMREIDCNKINNDGGVMTRDTRLIMLALIVGLIGCTCGRHITCDVDHAAEKDHVRT